MRKTFAAALMLLCQMALGQLTHIDPTWIMPAGKIFIDNTTVPNGRLGKSTSNVDWVCTGAWPGTCGSSFAGNTAGGGSDGAFRISCRTSHFGYDDPIVWPSQPGKTHLHVFFGNNTTSSDSDLNNQANIGTSTCDGGIANRTGYWAPVVVYHCPNPTLTGCDPTRNGKVYIPTNNLVYYKTGLLPAQPPLSSMEWPPAKFRMIGGNATSTTIQSRPFFSCLDAANAFNTNFTGRIPVTAEATPGVLGYTCTDLLENVAFPQCWDGVNLDSPDHKSHMAEINKGASPGPKCDTIGYTNHIFPDISYNIHYTIDYHDLDYLRLSSDLPETYGATQTSADASHIQLAATEQSTTDYYKFGMLFIGGVGHQITAYDGTTKIATVVSPFGATPSVGTAYAVRNPGGITIHGDWVNGWDLNTLIVPAGRTVPQQILNACLKPAADCTAGLLFDADPSFPANNGTTRWYRMDP